MFDIKKYTSLNSTNSEAWKSIKLKQAGAGTVILADYQSHGKGQGYNTWHSEAGKNLLFSVVLEPVELPLEKHFYLSRMISLSVINTLSAFNTVAQIKWPNDILVQRKKIGGILIENSLQGSAIKHSVAGVGLNVNQTVFPKSIEGVTSLLMQTNNTIPIKNVLETFLDQVKALYAKLNAGAYAWFKEHYNRNLLGYGKLETYRDGTGVFNGRIVQVDDDGCLHIAPEDGQIKQYYFKEVEWLNREF